MIGDEYAPGRLDRLLRAIPEGTILRGLFLGLLAMAAGVAGLDYAEMAGARQDAARTSRTEPLPLARPRPGDQIRPYLPRTIPVGPDRGEPRLPGYDGPVDGEAMDRPMRFIVAGEGVLTAVGRIDPGTARDFAAFLEAEAAHGAPVRRLVLHSPGGSVDDALAMARLVRGKRIVTAVPDDGYCASACPLLFAGGLERIAGAQSWIGVHQVFAVDTAAGRPRDLDRSIADIQATIAECQQLLLDMGVKPELWIKAMKTPPDALYVLTEEELRGFAMVTLERFGPALPAHWTPPARARSS